MSVTVLGLGAIIVFGMLGYFRGLYKIVAAFAAFLLAALLAKPIAFPLVWLVAKSHAVPQSLAPLASQLLAGILLFLLFYGGAGLLLRKLDERRDTFNRPRLVLWERICGAALGVAWGAFLVTLTLAGLHLIGNVEEVLAPPAQPAPAKEKAPAAASSASSRGVSAAVEKAKAPQAQAPAPEKKFVALKKQIEASVFGGMIQKADPVSDKVAGAFQNLTIVVNNPTLYSELKRHPAIARFTNDPRFSALSGDQQIQQQLRDKQYYALLDNDKIAALLKDKALVGELKTVDLGAVLKELLGENSAAQTPAASPSQAAKCDRCIGNDGKNKDVFGTEMEAAQRAVLIQKDTGLSLYAYACPYKKGWHLTKKKNGP